jgi:hypothetical protein
VNPLVYRLPKFVHRFIRFVTGYCLVEYQLTVYVPRRKLRRQIETVRYYWRKL